MRRIVVKIHRVVLHGVRPEDRHAFALGLCRALERSLAEPDAWSTLSALGDRQRLVTERVRLAPDTTPRVLGARVGRHVSDALTGSDHHNWRAPTP